MTYSLVAFNRLGHYSEVLCINRSLRFCQKLSDMHRSVQTVPGNWFYKICVCGAENKCGVNLKL